MKSLVLLPFLFVPLASPAQTIISDTFDVAGGNSAAGGFGTDGVNTGLDTRLTGQAAQAEFLSWVATGAAKDPASYTIASNALQIAPAVNAGTIQFSADGANAFDFGPHLVGRRYEVRFTLDNDSVATANRRMSWLIADAPNPGVDTANLGFQLQAEANQASASVFKRLSAVSNGATTAVNQSIASGLPYGSPVGFRVVIEDIDITGVQASSYEVYLNGSATPADSGLFSFIRRTRYLVFDIAPSTGPATIDDYSVTVTGPAAEPPDIGDRYLYFVTSAGEIRSFTGISAGAVPVAARLNVNGGVLEATQADYAGYQAFAIDPTTGIVYGINAFGDVVRWPTLADWLADTNAMIPDFDTPGFAAYGSNGSQGSVHGASYDPATGGFYVIYEGDASIDGDVGHYATAADFLANANATVSPSTYGGNLINFHYSGEDAPGNVNAATPGANYFQASSAGQLEGFQTLASYIADPNNRTFQRANFCVGAVDAFALPVPVPTDLRLEISGVQRNTQGEVTSVVLSWQASEGASYNLLGSTDLTTGFSVLPGYAGVTTSPQTVTLPPGFGERGFFSIEVAP